MRFSYSGKKVLVTGAGGFIGSHLVERLIVEGAEVTAALKYNSSGSLGNLGFLKEDVRSQARLVWGNIEDPEFTQSIIHGTDIVFHLAALIGIPYSYNAPNHYLSTNINGTLNILNALKGSERSRLVHTSTSETYGTAQYVPIDEKHPLVGQSPYSATKIAADKLVEAYVCSFDLPALTIRPFNTYGPRQSERAIVPTVIKQLLDEHDELVLGDLSPVRDMVFVADTVDGFVKAGCAEEKAFGETINLATGEGYSIAQIVEQLKFLTGSKAKVTLDPQRQTKNSEVIRLISENKKA